MTRWTMISQCIMYGVLERQWKLSILPKLYIHPGVILPEWHVILGNSMIKGHKISKWSPKQHHPYVIKPFSNAHGLSEDCSYWWREYSGLSNCHCLTDIFIQSVSNVFIHSDNHNALLKDTNTIRLIIY